MCRICGDQAVADIGHIAFAEHRVQPGMRILAAVIMMVVVLGVGVVCMLVTTMVMARVIMARVVMFGVVMARVIVSVMTVIRVIMLSLPVASCREVMPSVATTGGLRSRRHPADVPSSLRSACR